MVYSWQQKDWRVFQYDEKAFSSRADDLALAFIAPLGADHDYETTHGYS